MTESFTLSRHHLEEKLMSLFLASMIANKGAYAAIVKLSSVIAKKYLRFLGGKHEGQQNLDDLGQEILISIHQVSKREEQYMKEAMLIKNLSHELKAFGLVLWHFLPLTGLCFLGQFLGSRWLKL